MAKLPEHVVKQYGSARAFRQRKRQIVREMRSLLSELRLGTAYFPDGGITVGRIDYELGLLAHDLSVKEWGQ